MADKRTRLYEDPRQLESRMVTEEEERALRDRDVEFRDRPVEGGIASPVDLFQVASPAVKALLRTMMARPAAKAAAQAVVPPGNTTVPGGGRNFRDMGEDDLEALISTMQQKVAPVGAPAPREAMFPMRPLGPLETRVGAPGGPAPEDPMLGAIADAKEALKRIAAQKDAAGTIPARGRR